MSHLFPQRKVTNFRKCAADIGAHLKSLSIKTTKFTKFFFSNRSIGLNMY